MKFYKIFILLLIISVTVQANPRHRDHQRRPARHSHQSRYSRPHHNYYWGYRYHSYYTPTIVTTSSTTTYPTNLVTITAESVSQDIIALNRLMERGVISEKDYERAKKTLLNRIGMSMNPDAQETTTTDIVGQIETLYQMNSKQLITEKEYKQQKNRLLAMI